MRGYDSGVPYFFLQAISIDGTVQAVTTAADGGRGRRRAKSSFYYSPMTATREKINPLLAFGEI
jgi:hypothetical protein